MCVKINKITDNKRVMVIIVECLSWQFHWYNMVYQTVGIERSESNFMKRRKV